MQYGLQSSVNQSHSRVLKRLTMHQPSPRVIGLESQDKEPVTGEKSNVASRRVFKVQVQVTDLIGLCRLLQNRKVMAVQMDRVGDGDILSARLRDAGPGDEEVDPLIRLGVLDDDDRVGIPVGLLARQVLG